MSDLKKILSALPRLEEEDRKHRIASQFGINPSLLEPEPSPSEQDVSWSQVNAITKAVKELGECVEVSLMAQTDKLADKLVYKDLSNCLKAIEGALVEEKKATDKRFAELVNAHTESTQKAVEAAIKASGAGMAEVLAKLGEQSKEHHDMACDMMAKLVPEPKTMTMFHVERDKNGLIATIIASPVDTYEPKERVTYK